HVNNLNFSSGKCNLSQNFPNPFSISTLISYQLNVCSFVTIKVYDPMGMELAVLVNDYKLPGSHAVHFTATPSRYPAGIYYVQMKCNDFIQTRKMVITK
ncbi:MAG: T9SS type A sorting domain-containing protein, partial [Bacteroidetes bacterium]|nr:T9SS type A sorting domain-containing protein [Bacteroidota bacterium]